MSDRRTPNAIQQRLAILQTAALSALSVLEPFGHTIAFAIAETLTRRRLDRIERTGREVGEALEFLRVSVSDLEQRLSDERITELVIRALAGAAETSREEKRHAFAAVIVNSVIAVEPREEEQRYFVELIERMRPVHFAVLQIYASSFDDNDERTLADLLATQEDRDTFDELATMAATDLFNWGLIEVAQTMYGHWRVSDFPAAPLKPLGARFLGYVTMPDRAGGTTA